MPRPSWRVLAGGGAAVAVVIALIVVRGDGDLGGGCLPGLVAHLPRDASVMSGTDLDRARAAGLEVDGDPDDLVQQDGSTLWLRAPLTGDVADWTRPIVVFDPAITIGTDLLGDD